MILSMSHSGKREGTPSHKRSRRTGTCTATHWLSHTQHATSASSITGS
jgi:hypothetical protein